MKVLVIHHLEPMWERGYKSFGTSFDELQEKFIDFLSRNRFDKIILTRFEEWLANEDDGYFYELHSQLSEVRSYAYGWERGEMEENPAMFCEGGSHSEAVLIEDWMRRLVGCDVTIAGAFDGECIEDLEIALRYVGVDFKREENLIV